MPVLAAPEGARGLVTREEREGSALSGAARTARAAAEVADTEVLAWVAITEPGVVRTVLVVAAAVMTTAAAAP